MNVAVHIVVIEVVQLVCYRQTKFRYLVALGTLPYVKLVIRLQTHCKWPGLAKRQITYIEDVTEKQRLLLLLLLSLCQGEFMLSSYPAHELAG